MTTEQAQIGARRQLVKGREYRLEFYTTKERINAAFIGEVRDKSGVYSIFSNDKSYIFIDNHGMNQEKGVINNDSMSSSSMKLVDREKLEISSKLIKMLEELGEII